MLDDKQIDLLVERILRRVEKANQNILIEIGQCIKEIGDVIPSRALQLAQILKYGGNYNKIIDEIARMTKLSIQDIQDIFEVVAKENYLFAEQYYKYKDVEFVPFEENEALQKELKAMTKNVAENFAKYFTSSTTGMTTRVIGYDFYDLDGKRTFVGLKKAYERVIDEAVLNISQGKTSYESAMSKIIKDMGGNGLKYVEYESGLHRRLDTALRMNLNDTLSHFQNTLQAQFGKEFGSDGVEISVHKNCAPDHLDIQGHQLTNEQYEKLQNHEDFEDVNGNKFDGKKRAILEYNCRHYFFSIVIGINKPNYSEEELEKIKEDNNKKINFRGKDYTGYELTQLQRELETKIRKWSDINKMAKASGMDSLVNASKSKMTAFNNEYHYLCKRGRLEPYYERIRIK